MIIHCPLCTRLVLLTGRNLAWHAVGKEECPYKVLDPLDVVVTSS